jgi:hypothetical protein
MEEGSSEGFFSVSSNSGTEEESVHDINKLQIAEIQVPEEETKNRIDGNKADTVPGDGKRGDPHDDENYEFVVKNLDTGESFSSKLITELIPEGIDPSLLDPITCRIQEKQKNS